MRQIFKFSAIQAFIYLVIIPNLILLLLILGTFINQSFMLFLLGYIILQILFSMLYNYLLGFYLRTFNNLNSRKSFNKFRLISIYLMAIALVYGTLFGLIIHGEIKLLTLNLLFLIPLLPAFFLQFYIPKYLATNIVKAEEVLFGLKSDLKKTIIMVTYPIYYNWKITPRIRKIFEAIDNKKELNS